MNARKRRKLMDEERARVIAQTFIENVTGREEKLISARKSEIAAHEWNVLFEATMPNGEPLDGEIIIVVDERTAKARFFPTL